MVARSSVALTEAPTDESGEEPLGTEAWRLEETEDATLELKTEVDVAAIAINIEPRDADRELVFESVSAPDQVIRAPALQVLLRPLAVSRLPAQIRRDIATIASRGDAGGGRRTVILAPNDLQLLPKEEFDRLTLMVDEAGAVLALDQARLAEINEVSEGRVARVARRLTP
jgi:hypothetical protein